MGVAGVGHGSPASNVVQGAAREGLCAGLQHVPMGVSVVVGWWGVLGCWWMGVGGGWVACAPWFGGALPPVCTGGDSRRVCHARQCILGSHPAVPPGVIIVITVVPETTPYRRASFRVRVGRDTRPRCGGWVLCCVVGGVGWCGWLGGGFGVASVVFTWCVSLPVQVWRGVLHTPVLAWCVVCCPLVLVVWCPPPLLPVSGCGPAPACVACVPVALTRVSLVGAALPLVDGGVDGLHGEAIMLQHPLGGVPRAECELALEPAPPPHGMQHLPLVGVLAD